MSLWDIIKRRKNRRSKDIIIICVFCLDLVLAFKFREGWRRDVGSPFFCTLLKDNKDSRKMNIGALAKEHRCVGQHTYVKLFMHLCSVKLY